jgi:hypothetical protein
MIDAVLLDSFAQRIKKYVLYRHIYEGLYSTLINCHLSINLLHLNANIIRQNCHINVYLLEYNAT